MAGVLPSGGFPAFRRHNRVEFPFIFGPAATRKAAAVFCLAMLLVASSVQVMHHCNGLEFGTSSQAENKGAVSSSPVLCSVCMTVQVAVFAVLIVVVAISGVRTFAPPVPHLLPPETILAFSLYVRPPPAVQS